MNPITTVLRIFAPAHPTDTRNLWLIRLFYLTYIGGSAFITPFFTLFYQRQGLTGAQIGALSTLGSICAMIAAPLWARLAGSVIRTKHAIQIGVLCSAASLLILSQQQHFGGMAAVVVARMLLTGGVSPLTVALVLKIIARTPGVGFGSVRVCASIGWAITSLIAGYVIERSSFESGFVTAAIVIVVSGFLLIPIFEEPPQPGRPATGEGAGSRPGVLSFLTADFGSLKNPYLALLAAVLSITWITRAGAANFQAIYMTQLGAGESLVGVMNMIGAVIEMPSMFLADRLLRRHGPVRLFASAFLINAASFLGVVLFPSITMILVLQAVNGLVLSLTSVSEMNYIQAHTRPEQTGSAIALITVTINALIAILVSPLAGLLFDARGAYPLFVIAVAGQLLAAVVLALGSREKRLSPPA